MGRALPALLLLLVPGLAAAEESRCALEGTVLDAITGQRLAGAQIFVRTHGEDTAPPVRRIANVAGAFCFGHLNPADYVVTAKKSGYLDANYGEKRPGASPLVLRMSAAEKLKPLTIKMTRQAVISGTLVDREGDPVRNAAVSLLGRSWSAGVLQPAVTNQAQTDEEGRFRVSLVAPGAYYLSAQLGVKFPGIRTFLDDRGQPFREREVPTYYKDSLSFERATPILVRAGQDVDGLTLTLEKAEGRHLSGMVRADARRSEPASVLMIQEEGGPFIGQSAPVNKDGSFRIDGVPPGRYQVVLVPMDGLQIRKEVDLTQGDLDGVVLEPLELLNLDVHVAVEKPYAAPKPLPIRRLFLAAGGMNQGSTCELDGHGKCKFEGILPDRYQVFADTEQPSFVKRILVDGQVQSEHSIDLRNRRAKSLEVIVSSRVASIEGQVTGPRELTTGVTVVLESAVGDSDIQSEAAGAKGEFTWKSLAPGSYRLYAFEDFDQEAWGNPELKRILSSNAVTVNLTEGELKQATVPLISGKQFEAAAAQTSF